MNFKRIVAVWMLIVPFLGVFFAIAWAEGWVDSYLVALGTVALFFWFNVAISLFEKSKGG